MNCYPNSLLFIYKYPLSPRIEVYPNGINLLKLMGCILFLTVSVSSMDIQVALT